MTQTYLTAQQLGISEDERTALIKTMDVLRAEQVVFNMGTQCDVRNPDGSVGTTSEPLPPCKTALCIGGTMKLLMLNDMQLPLMVTPEMGDRIVGYVDRVSIEGHSLCPLFWDVIDQSTPPKAGIEAIERFLFGNTSDPWLLAGNSDDEDEDY